MKLKTDYKFKIVLKDDNPRQPMKNEYEIVIKCPYCAMIFVNKEKDEKIEKQEKVRVCR